jgi:hypothetical protein
MVRAFDIAMATLALRASAPRPPKAERRLIPAIDDADAAMLNREALPQDRAARVASLWPPPTRQCVAPAVYAQLAAPAAFGSIYQVTWAPAPPVKPAFKRAA